MADSWHTMVSTGFRGTELSIKHLAKFLIFLYFNRHVKLKILRTSFKALYVGLSTKPVLTIAIVVARFFIQIFFHTIFQHRLLSYRDIYILSKLIRNQLF